MLLRRVPLILAALALAALTLAVLTGGAQPAGAAPGSPGAASTWAPAGKSFLGTSRTTASRVYFTGHRGIISEVFYPVADTVNTVDLQFLVGDTAKTYVDEEKLQNFSVTLPNPKSMRWNATTSNPGPSTDQSTVRNATSW